MSFTKHIGKYNNRQIAILYRKIPDEDHMCLVVYMDVLPHEYSDVIAKIINTTEAQNDLDLSEVLFKYKLPDGSSILNTLHKKGLIKKIPTKQVIVTPNVASHCRLDELNKLIDDAEMGRQAQQSLNDLEKTVGMANPVAPDMNDLPRDLVDVGMTVLTDEVLAKQNIAQATKMANEAQQLLAESKRLEEEAWKLDPSLKPKKTTRRSPSTKKKNVTSKAKTTTKKTTVKNALKENVEEPEPEKVAVTSSS